MPPTDEHLARLICFYLPQFHPTPENDAWWGKGFTEWTNVTKARPHFRGHYQPHLPADLGFYDLRLPEAREAQADLARQYGIHAFCYYHYWFHGWRMLPRPFQEVLDSGRPDFPFCLCWANENWSRNWDGGNRELLMGQDYSPEDDRRHIEWLLQAFEDSRYVQIDGRPVMLVYRATYLPEPRRMTDLWRDAARRRGFPDLYLCRVEALAADEGDPRSLGFDAAVEFQPDFSLLGSRLLKRRGRWGRAMADFFRRVPGLRRGRDLAREVIPSRPAQHVFRYSDVVEWMLAKAAVPYRRFPGVTPSWDNTARRGRNALVLHRSTPELYEGWLAEVLRRHSDVRPEENLVFINGWNEWAEGNHLEPDLRFGRAYLEATRRALETASAQPSEQPRMAAA